MYQYSSQYSSKTNVDSHNQFMSNMNSSFNKFYYSSSSWEEQAGFVWPPRCYCCNFCKREFRSAQALGGHMNVHRRDRAKLKHDQSLCPQNQAVHDESLSKSKTTLSNSQKQSPARVNSCTNSKTVALTNYSDEPTNFSRLASPVIKKRLSSSPDLKRTSDEKGARKEVILLDDENYVEANLSVGISMAASEYPKRQKSSMFLSSPILHKPYCWSDKYCLSTSGKLGIRTSYMEDIDLELRLGDPPSTS